MITQIKMNSYTSNCMHNKIDMYLVGSKLIWLKTAETRF